MILITIRVRVKRVSSTTTGEVVLATIEEEELSSTRVGDRTWVTWPTRSKIFLSSRGSKRSMKRSTVTKPMLTILSDRPPDILINSGVTMTMATSLLKNLVEDAGTTSQAIDHKSYKRLNNSQLHLFTSSTIARTGIETCTCHKTSSRWAKVILISKRAPTLNTSNLKPHSTSLLHAKSQSQGRLMKVCILQVWLIATRSTRLSHSMLVHNLSWVDLIRVLVQFGEQRRQITNKGFRARNNQSKEWKKCNRRHKVMY